jgi:hypothetical protein
MVCKSRQNHSGYWLYICVLLFIGLNSVVNAAVAATRYVNPNSCPDTNGPEVYCKIQWAIDASGQSDIIFLAPGSYQESLRLTNPTSRSLTIVGSGLSHTIIDSYSRAFLIREDVTIKHLTMDVVGPPAGGSGGGVNVQGNAIVVDISDAVIKNGKALFGGGIYIHSGTVNLTRVAILNNSAELDPADTSNSGPLGGGVYVRAGATFVAINSVVSANFANAHQNNGGSGAGIYNLGTTTLVNTTVSGNAANAPMQRGGGITNGASNSAELNLYNVTITENSANIGGGGVYNFNGTVNVRNSIIAGNTVDPANGTAPNCGANSGIGFSSQGHNIIGLSDGCDDTIFPPGTNDSKDIVVDQLNLSPLPITDPVNDSPFDNIPVFLAHGLNMNSPAIDNVDVNSCLEQNNNALNDDQRGAVRPFDGNSDNTSLCDTGAIELVDEVIVYPSELTTFEDQGISNFYVALAKAPAQTVQLDISSQMLTEGTIATPTITFDTNDWSTPKAVQINVQNDGLGDGNQTYAINISASGYTPKLVTVTNIDTVIPPGIVVDTTSINIREGGPSKTFKVKLTTPPAIGTVVDVDVGSDEGNGQQKQAIFAPTFLEFNDSNWSIYQDVIVTADDDPVVDGSASYNVIISVAATSTDGAYLGKTASIPITVDDNDQPAGVPGVTFTGETGLVTTEDGDQVTFSAVLDSAPSADVTINFVSNDTSEGLLFSEQTQQLAQALPMVFTPLNWYVPQSVTVVGVDDDFADGGKIYDILTQTISDDASYSGTNPPDIRITNNDNDEPGIIVIPTSGLITDESGASATLQVKLSTPPEPNTEVVLTATVQPPGSGQPLEGVVTLPQNQLVFNSNNYNQPQSVTVSGLDDCIPDGNKIYTVDISLNSVSTSSPPYASSNLQQSVSVTNLDNDSAISPQIIVSKTQLHTSETQTSDSLDVCLTAQPSTLVTITMTIPAGSESEGVFSANGSNSLDLVFDQTTWSEIRTVTIAGLDDAINDGDQTYQLSIDTVSADPVYAGMVIPAISVTNTDDDTGVVDPGFVVTKSQPVLTTSENETSDSFSLSLARQPSTTVYVEITITDETEGRISGNSPNNTIEKTLVFGPDNWNNPQTISIVGIDDSEDDGNIQYDVLLTTREDSAEEYRPITARIQVINEDNDILNPVDPGFDITKPEPNLSTSEKGKSDSFSLKLTSQPSATVYVLITIDGTEGRIDGASSNNTNEKTLIFEPGNWNNPQTISIVGVDDSEDDGNILYDVLLTTTEDSAEEYRSISAQIPVINEDDDVLNPVDSTGGGHLNPGLLCLLFGLVILRYRFRITRPTYCH